MTDLTVKSALSKEGWNLSDDGYVACSSACADDAVSPKSLHEIALNQDLRKIGNQCLPNSISRGVLQKVKAPLILQIQKVTNIAVPSYHQHDGSGGGVRLLKLQLTDGHTYCNALELKHTPQLNLSIPPGTKLKITSDVMARNGFLLLMPTVVKVLGGHVEHMVEKWKASKMVVVTERSNKTGYIGDGPPPFVPFSEVVSKKQYSDKHTETKSGAAEPPQKHSNQPKQDLKRSSGKQMEKPKPHQHHFDKAYDTASYKQTVNKPHQHHQTKLSHQRDRLHDKSFQAQPSKQRMHNPQYRRSKGHANDRSQGQPLSDLLPIAFDNSEKHFPALTHPTSHMDPKQHSIAPDDKQLQPPHKPMLAWDTQTSNTSTGGSVPFSAKRNI